jgi:chitinase
VQYATSDGSATISAGDYQAASGMLSFAPGETRKTVTVLVNGDHLAEHDESFGLNLTNPTGAGIADGEGKASVLDDEPRIHVPGFLLNPEGNVHSTILLRVNLSVPSTQTVTVNYATADGTATAPQDYKPTAGTLTFNPGETRKTIEIRMPKDTTAEPIVEAFFLNLTDASGSALILRRGVVHVVDDDLPPARQTVAHNTGASVAFGNIPRTSAPSNVFATGSSILDAVLRDNGDFNAVAVWELVA